MEKVKEKIRKLKAKFKRLDNTVKTKGIDDKSNHLSFVEKIVQQQKLKSELVRIKNSPESSSKKATEYISEASQSLK
jgi:hypothetical protein